MAADPFAGERRSRAFASRGPGPLRSFVLQRISNFSYPGTEAEQLLLAPQDLRTADPSFATEIYNGHFGLAGSLVELGAQSPFEIAPPTEGWARELHGFGWLRHLRVASSTLSREQAKALLGDFLKMHKSVRGLAWQPEVVARRVISWLSNSVVVLDANDPRTYETFLHALTVQLRYLSASYRDAPDGAPRLLAIMALVYAGLCIAEQQAVLDRYLKPFCKELDRQILPDGVHISRNPAALFELLLDLLPLRQTFEARSMSVPVALETSIARMIPMLRLLRLGDGSIAQFNGMGATPTDILAAVLAYDDMRSQPLFDASHSGFQRLESGGSVVVADTGVPPPEDFSAEAHAGCLSFEFSVKRHRVVINCGMPSQNRGGWAEAARATAAHSTVTWHDTSSCRFRETRDGTVRIAQGPFDVKTARAGREDAVVVRASHDGYELQFGIIHQRSWRLSPDGDRLDGEDMFSPSSGHSFPAHTPDDYVIRFHLHPSVKASRVKDGRTVLLILPGRESWLFTAPSMLVELEESIFLSASEGPRRTSQIVIADNSRSFPRVVWTFARADAPGQRRREEEPDPLLPI